MPIIDLGKELEAALHDPFWAIRGLAIQAYANLEQSISRLFAHVAGMTTANAGIIFFKIHSARVRMRTVDQLFRKHFAGQYNQFWKSVNTACGDLSDYRNRVVHWNAFIEVHNDGSSVGLIPSDFFGSDLGTSPIFAPHLLAFSSKCDVYSRALTGFTFTICQPPASLPDAARAPWLEIFQHPLPYPLPEGHLLSVNYKVSEALPRPLSAGEE